MKRYKHDFYNTPKKEASLLLQILLVDFLKKGGQIHKVKIKRPPKLKKKST